MSGVVRSSKLVQFTNFHGIVAQSGTFSKTAAVNWNACAASTDGIQSSQSCIRGVSFVIPRDGIDVMLGWASNEAQRGRTHFDSVTYAVDISSCKDLRVYESGTHKGTFGTARAGDTVAVVLNDQSNIDYCVNGEVRYTSQQPPQFPLYLKLCAYSQGPCAQQVQWILRETAKVAPTAGDADSESECPECNILKDALQSMADEKAGLEVHLAKVEADYAKVKADLVKANADNQALRKQLGLKSRRQSDTSSSKAEPEREPMKGDGGC